MQGQCRAMSENNMFRVFYSLSVQELRKYIGSIGVMPLCTHKIELKIAAGGVCVCVCLFVWGGGGGLISTTDKKWVILRILMMTVNCGTDRVYNRLYSISSEGRLSPW